MRTLEDFPRSEWRDSTEKLRRIDPSNAAKVSYKDLYWSVPVLIRLLERVDEFLAAGEDPDEAVKLAEPLPNLARSIPIRSEGRDSIRFYLDAEEAGEFVVFAHCALSSAYRAAAMLPEARFQSEKALTLADECSSKLARAEAMRRTANLLDELCEFDNAKMLLSKASQLFDELKDFERLALTLICLGNVQNNLSGPGSGTREYASALYYAAHSRSKRAQRAISFAASCLAIDIARTPHVRIREVLGSIESAKSILRQHPLGVPRLTVRWAEAIAVSRCGLGRYAIKRLVGVRDGLLKRKALSRALVCVSDLLEIAKEQGDREEFESLARDSAAAITQAMKGSTPTGETARIVEAWLKRPVDVEALRGRLARRALISHRE